MSIKNNLFLRTLLEGLARNKVIKRRLPNGNYIYLSPDSQLKYISRRFDVDLIQIANRFVDRESIVWDIGANCGVFSFSSTDAKEVVAVEADPFLQTLLERTNYINNTSVVRVSAAVSGETVLAGFSIAKRGRASNHLSAVSGNSQTGGERSRIYLQTITLDGLLSSFSPPTFVKIDVEGAEVDVLKGATNLLTRVKPVIYLETVSDTHAACQDILEMAGYRMEPAAEMNWLCIPRST